MIELKFSPLPAGLSVVKTNELFHARWMIRACINVTGPSFATLPEGPRPSDCAK